MIRFARSAVDLIVAVVMIAAVGGATPAFAQATSQPVSGADRAADHAAFVEALDLTAFSRVAVHRDGRVKTFESFAREMMSYVTGGRLINEQPATVTYLDLMLRPRAYDETELIFVKSKVMRAQIADVLRSSMREQLDSLRTTNPSMADALDERQDSLLADLETRLARFQKSGLIAEPMLLDPQVTALLARLETDILRGAKYVRMVESALGVRDERVLRDSLRVVPPPTGGFEAPWLTLDDMAAAGHDEALIGGLDAAWARFQQRWIAGDAAGVNAAADKIAAQLPTVNPDLYPSMSRLGWESWYFRWKNMTWVWIIYALGVIPLILHLVFRWSGARGLGLAMFVAAWGLHTFAVMLRWYVAQRWPNTNMFEAVTTAAWMGGSFAIILEIWLRRTPMRSLFALGSGVASCVALMCAHYLPLELNASLSNRMPVLHDVWLYIHTNVIIFSYCLIFIAAVSAVLYLLYRTGRALFGGRQGGDGQGGSGGAGEYARVGGAGSLMLKTPDGNAYLTQSRATLGQVLDGTTMIVLELSFILLWTGIVMGAIWADHSWGRPWGWDPKEVFALNTFIIFALLIHTRLKVRDKGLWTAILAIVGCVVMLFNWIIINFTISGLHSYA